MKKPMPKKWGWDIYYWPKYDQVFTGRDGKLYDLMTNPRWYCRLWTGNRRPKTLVKVGEL